MRKSAYEAISSSLLTDRNDNAVIGDDSVRIACRPDFFSCWLSIGSTTSKISMLERLISAFDAISLRSFVGRRLLITSGIALNV